MCLNLWPVPRRTCCRQDVLICARPRRVLIQLKKEARFTALRIVSPVPGEQSPETGPNLTENWSGGLLPVPDRYDPVLLIKSSRDLFQTWLERDHDIFNQDESRHRK